MRTVKSTKAFVPKGGMCSNCVKNGEDCSSLPFHTMFPIHHDKETNIVYVRCTQHKK